MSPTRTLALILRRAQGAPRPPSKSTTTSTTSASTTKTTSATTPTAASSSSLVAFSDGAGYDLCFSCCLDHKGGGNFGHYTCFVSSLVVSPPLNETLRPFLQGTSLVSASASATATDSASTSAAASNSATASTSKAPAISVTGIPSVQASSSSTTASAAATQPAAGNNAGADPVPVISSAATATPTAAEDQQGASSTSASSAATSSAAALARANTQPQTLLDAVPGRQLSVLPIGLGVFAGIMFIGACVVAYVMYERKKYRKNFRNRTQVMTQYGGV
ncbi:hypothetical protein FRC04_006915 [Tulasnella sp. 424]|nr:hypothetical protein FRC04_006915 [Tulasnella sp. 424]